MFLEFIVRERDVAIGVAAIEAFKANEPHWNCSCATPPGGKEGK